MAQCARLSSSAAVALALLSACGGGGKKADPIIPAPDRSYVRLQSDVGDPVGGGSTYAYTRTDAQIAINAVGGHLALGIVGDESWTGDFVLPSALSELRPGTYGGLGSFPSHDPAKGGLSWWNPSRYCYAATGSLTIERAVYEGGALTSLDLRFEQHCEGRAPALHGEIHWVASDTASPPGPVAPPPAGLWRPAAGTTPATGSFVYLQSEVQDYVGAGQTYLHSSTDSLLTVTSSGNQVSVGVIGDQSWKGDFQAMTGLTRLEPGYYGNLRAYPFHNPVRGGLFWSGEGRACSSVTGWMAIDAVTYAGGALTAIELRFEQHCQGGAAALRGQLRWSANDGTQPPGPVSPPPGGLWTPAPGSTPTSGNFVYLVSDAGDYIGAGQAYVYTQADALLAVAASGGHLGVNVTGDQSWSGDFQAMSSISRLQPGYYGSLRRYPFHNPVRGGLSWSGVGRGCSTLTGWFMVDAITWSGTTLTAIDLRFEQHCEGGGPALHGQIHWVAGDTTAPPGPVSPPPAGLWTPAPGVTPTGRNYVYLESEAGDYVGAGQTHTYTQADAVLSVVATGAHLGVSVQGDQTWNGDFQAMNVVAQLEPGYYGSLGRYPFHSPVRGGLAWGGEGRGCNTLTGWFVVDAITWSGTTLTAIDLRFEQHCEGAGPALRGQIHWAAGDTTAPPGPVSPPPAGLWAPAPGVTPTGRNYVYLESEAGDYVGRGGTFTHTQADALLTVGASGGYLGVAVDGAQRWGGSFQAMSSASRLEPGYYGNLHRYPFQNPVRGGLTWAGDWGGCNTLTGWFVVDSVTWSGNLLTAIDLRFEQHCEGAIPALRGQIHWSSSDTTAPPGPVSPPPGGLWTPAPGATPGSGSYLYLTSDLGDYIGGGETYVYTPASGLGVVASGPHLWLGVNGPQFWTGDFQAMSGRSRLEPGYYGDLRRYPFHNPVRGGLSWSGEGRGCNTLSGWFVVDSVTYSADALTAIDLRFEQHCEGSSPALHGQLHWTGQ